MCHPVHLGVGLGAYEDRRAKLPLSWYVLCRSLPLSQTAACLFDDLTSYEPVYHMLTRWVTALTGQRDRTGVGTLSMYTYCTGSSSRGTTRSHLPFKTVHPWPTFVLDTPDTSHPSVSMIRSFRSAAQAAEIVVPRGKSELGHHARETNVTHPSPLP